MCRRTFCYPAILSELREGETSPLLGTGVALTVSDADSETNQRPSPDIEMAQEPCATRDQHCLTSKQRRFAAKSRQAQASGHSDSDDEQVTNWEVNMG
jgi:hypothetical protein